MPSLGAIGATWVAIGVTPAFFGPEFMSWRGLARLVTFVGLGSALSWFGGWLVTRGDGVVRLVRAGFAALAAAGLVLAGFSSAQMVSWQIYAGGLGGELGWEWVLRALLLPLGCGLTVGLAARMATCVSSGRREVRPAR